jgi:beta-lactamase regulating signal transducer with metallopeptidase domain
MSWLFYLLEANLYLAIFYCFFKIFLNKDTFYSLNRYYLIFSTIISFCIPFFKVGVWNKETFNAVDNVIFTEQAINPSASIIQYQQSNDPIFTLNSLLFAVYLFVTLLLLFRLLKGFIHILKIKRLDKYRIENGVKIIYLKKSKSAFSFFNLLFIDPELENQSTIIKHEMAHIKQGHSFDILFYEFIGVINWFNPAVYLIKKDIKLIHEYLADTVVIDSDMKKYDYAMFLIKQSANIESLLLTNQIFSSSLLKQRISMLNQNKTAGWVRLKMLFVLPIIGCLLGLSTMAFTKTYGTVELFKTDKKSIQDTRKIKYTTMRNLKKGSKLFITHVSVKNKKQTSSEKRLIVINGEEIKDNNQFFAVANFDQQTELMPDKAVKKYGDKAKYGAIEFNGTNIEVLKDLPPPPPGRPNTPDSSLAPPPPLEPKVEIEKYPNPTTAKDVVLNRGKNERFVLPEMSSGRKSLQVMNAAGMRIYSTFNYANDWDGKQTNITKLKNKKIPAGKYMYIVFITKKDNQPNDAKKGYLTII